MKRCRRCWTCGVPKEKCFQRVGCQAVHGYRHVSSNAHWGHGRRCSFSWLARSQELHGSQRRQCLASERQVDQRVATRPAVRVATITFKPADHAANERHRDQTVAMRRQVGHGAASLSDVDQSVAKSSVFGECGYDHSDIRGYGARRQPASQMTQQPRIYPEGT